MKKIGVVSDTHGMLRKEVMDALKGCDAILHGGDINKQEILDALAEIAPVYVVRGNNDKGWAEHIPEYLQIELFGIRIYMVHNKKHLPEYLPDTELIIYGHSHKYEERKAQGKVYLNPGSCGPRMFHQEITLAVIRVEDSGKFQIEKLCIPHPNTGKRAASPTENGIPKDLADRLPAIMREIDAHKTVKQIAKKYQISEELSEQINRMYLTHPGVNVEGILRRLELDRK